MDSQEFRDFVEKTKGKIDIVKVIGQAIRLDRYHKALCPFHQEATPSFSVNPTHGYFYCFGCGVGGDVIRFVELFEHKPFMVVLRELAHQAGLSVPSMSDEDRTRLSEHRVIDQIREATAGYYQRHLTREAVLYLHGRGFTDETLAQFRIGYACGGLKAYLVDQSEYPIDLCISAGILKRTDDGTVRDYFQDRIVFPAFIRGRVVHFTGRAIDGREPKYLHQRGEMQFLFNEDALQSQKVVYIAEGVPDCLTLSQAGYAVAAILGARAFKSEYVQKFAHCDKIFICTDADRAGRSGATKIAELIGRRARIVLLPDGMDVNEFFKSHTKDAFEKLVSAAPDPIQFELAAIATDTPKTELPSRLETIFKTLARMDKATTEAYLAYEIKPRFALKTEDIDGYRERIQKLRRSDSVTQNSEGKAGDGQDPIYTANFEGLVDLVSDGNKTAFLVKENERLVVLHQVERDGRIYLPPPKDQIPFLLPRGEKVIELYESQKGISPLERDGCLYDNLVAYFTRISELPGSAYYSLLAAWVMHTYLLETALYSPLLWFFALPERGKTRTGKGLTYVAYRGLHVESLRDAYLVRVSNNLRATIFFDVKGIQKKLERHDTEDVLLCRFEKGVKVPRVLFPDRGPHRDIVYFDVFGASIIASNEHVEHILETRTVQINMPETSRRFDNEVTREGSLPMKERLVVFRAFHLGENLPDISKPTTGRLGDIMKPLFQIIRLVKPDVETLFMRLIEEIRAGRLIEKSESLEAKLLKTMDGLKDQVTRGLLSVKLITDTFNAGKIEKDQITYQRVGRRLNAMGFHKGRLNDGARAILWDAALIERMKETHGLHKPSETSDTSVMSHRSSGDTAVSDVTEG